MGGEQFCGVHCIEAANPKYVCLTLSRLECSISHLSEHVKDLKTEPL